MSYLVIARKWRPQTFDEVIGQPHVTKTLQNAINSGRIAHAYLFTGARGVGKTSIARILAKALNCEKGPSPKPCNECSNCREITQGAAVDVLEIDGASNRGIDSIRELRETVRYRPTKSRYKVYIIDEVHMLTQEAFNALLKTLEEPPEHVVFIFATTEPHKMPATILSRCQRFDFRRIPTSMLVKHLGAVAGREGMQISETVLYAIAREADGSMRGAQSLLEQLLAFSGDGLQDQEVLDVLGVVDRRSVHQVGRAVLAGDVRACLEGVEELYRRGTDSKRFCQQLCDYFRNLLLLALEAQSGEGGLARLDLPEEEAGALRDAARETSPESLHLCFQMMLKGEEEIRRSSMPRIALEMLLLRLAQLPRLESLDALLERIAALEKGGCVAPSTLPSPRGGRGSEAPRRMERSEREYRGIAPEPPSGPGDPEPPPYFPEKDGMVPDATPSESAAMQPDAGFEHPPAAGGAPASDMAGSEDISKAWPKFVKRLHEEDPVLSVKLASGSASVDADGVLEVEVNELYEEIFKDPAKLEKLRAAVQSYFGASAPSALRVRALAKASPEHSARAEKAAPKPNLKRSVMEHPLVLAAIEILSGELVDIRRTKSGGGERDKGRQ